MKHPAIEFAVWLCQATRDFFRKPATKFTLFSCVSMMIQMSIAYANNADAGRYIISAFTVLLSSPFTYRFVFGSSPFKDLDKDKNL
jgi:hypothetical protein